MSAKNELAKLYKDGLEVRRDVLGTEYVDGSIAKANDFTMAFQHITTEMCWGYAWTRPGLSRKTRSMLNLAMLTALNRSAEIKLHVKGALTNGVTVEEIKEVLLHATVYCGIPAGLDAFKAANQVLEEQGAYEKAAKKAAKKAPAKKAPAKKAAVKKAAPAKKAPAKKVAK
jgi:4-carboxymuconolactone decarboxylase